MPTPEEVTSLPSLRERATALEDDVEEQPGYVDLLARYVDERGATLVTVTHDHELLSRFDRVLDFKQFSASDSS